MLFGSRFKQGQLAKWRNKPPQPDKLLLFWPQMDELARRSAVRLAAEGDWPEMYLQALPDETAAEAFLLLWPELAADRQEALLKRLLDLWPTQPAAVELLLRLGDERVISPLIALALQSETYRPEDAARVLAAHRQKSGRVLALVYREVNTAARGRILRLLAFLRPETSEPILRQAMREPSAELRQLAAKITAEVRPPDVVEFLQPLLTDEEISVRMAACETLGQYEGVAERAVLQRIFAEDEAWPVKSMCASFLRKWEDELAVQLLLDEQDGAAANVAAAGERA